MPVLLGQTSGIVEGGIALDYVLEEATPRRPYGNELRSLHPFRDLRIDGHRLMWGYPRRTPDGNQLDLVQLDLVEVMELDGARNGATGRGLSQNDMQTSTGEARLSDALSCSTS
ncbi:hypothetical protein O4220_17810 [Rhodococcus ruber]|uniref:Uncharacterized protein n=1 Tax=Rhodococcus ruber TaxID=1830 RepID=A0ABT4MHB0_9NOCA|nr:hypothetical protein [Rhodococcus ruber]MCZ4520373.1 hypothetical protein [Rhodococcus ruber]